MLGLQADGRASLAQLARELSVTQKRVRRHLDHLLSAGTIRVTAVADPRALGYRSGALIGIVLNGTRDVPAVIADLVAIPRVAHVVATAGPFAIIAEIFCRDDKELLVVSGSRIATLPGVGSLELFRYLKVHYQRFTPLPISSGDGAGVAGPILDEVDARIVRELTLDGRVPTQTLARRLEISETQARNRIRTMTEAGHLRVAAIVYPLGSGYGTMAWLGVRVARGHSLGEVAERLAVAPSVSYVTLCTGRFDAFVIVVSESQDDLLRVLDEEIRPIPGVGRVEVSVHLSADSRPLLPLEG